MDKSIQPTKWKISVALAHAAAKGSFRTNEETKTYNSEDSLVVTHPTTN
ncbi:hypothetical protein VN97_g12800, partial [Penicillium thymicola]